MKMAIPQENLSRSEYIPKTNAPDLPLVPTTSEIMLIPVANTKDCDAP